MSDEEIVEKAKKGSRIHVVNQDSPEGYPKGLRGTISYPYYEGEEYLSVLWDDEGGREVITHINIVRKYCEIV
jgi:hypothetical protein